MHGEVSRREGRNCIERVGTYKTRMWYCICDNKDGCNDAASRFGHGGTWSTGKILLLMLGTVWLILSEHIMTLGDLLS